MQGDFLDSSDYAHGLTASIEAEARRIEPWAWVVAMLIIVLIVAGGWRLVAWVVA